MSKYDVVTNCCSTYYVAECVDNHYNEDDNKKCNNNKMQLKFLLSVPPPQSLSVDDVVNFKGTLDFHIEMIVDKVSIHVNDINNWKLHQSPRKY